MIKDCIKLMRPKHYLKNGLIFLPLVFSGALFDSTSFVHVLIAAVMFSLASSIVYIINDIKDAEKDKLHVKKRHRPIASGKVPISVAVCLIVVLMAIVVTVGLLIGINLAGWLLIASYVSINIGYSFGLKHIPIMDVAILAAGFVIRVFYGASIVGIDVSSWLYLTVIAGAFYMALGKRRNEILVTGTESRKVNQLYSVNFLDKNMYVALSLLLVFYSLWTIDSPTGNESLFWTVPLVMLLFMLYSHNLEKEGSLGDPVEVLLGDKILLLLSLLYVILAIGILYI
jgi:decaprenyl-phosphate phosphoribosyltransferase